MQELEAFEGLLAEGMHAFGLFGLSPDAGKADVRRAWGDLSRKFHPDALQSKKLGHLRERVEQVFAALSEAHMQLADDAQREDLKHLLEMGGGQLRPGQDASAVALAALESEVIAKEADKLLRGGHFKQALENYQRAAQMNPTELDLRAATAWCEYQVSARDEQAGRKAIGSLDAIIQEAPRLARAYYFRGLVMLALGNEDLAIGSFTEAHAIDPRLIDAERQARAIKIRRQNKGKVEDKSRFGLRNLFKK